MMDEADFEVLICCVLSGTILVYCNCKYKQAYDARWYATHEHFKSAYSSDAISWRP